MTKVSICIPAYKQTEYLRKVLDSIKAQTYHNYEIILTDDSPDNSVKNLLTTYDFSNKLRYYKNSKQLGSPQNWNKAVEYAEGEYIKMLHHDDYFTFDYSLEKYVESLEQNPLIDFAFSESKVIIVDKQNQWIHSANSEQLKLIKKDPKNLFLGNFIGAPSATIYKNIKVPTYDRNLKWVVDIDFYIQYLSVKKDFYFIKEPLITTTGGAMHSVTKQCENNVEVEIFEYLYLLKKHFANTFLLPKRHRLHLTHLFKRYNIDSVTDIRKAGFLLSIPKCAMLILRLRALSLNRLA